MNRRTLIILSVAFVALVVIALFQTHPTSSPNNAATLDSTIRPTTNAEQVLSAYTLLGKTISMTIDDISAIRLRNPQGDNSFAISRDSNGAWIAPNETGTLDATVATNIAKTVVLLPYTKTIAVKPDTKIADFGFRPEGVLSIEVVLRTNINHAIAIGDLTSTSDSYYGLVDDKKVIYLFERRAIDYLLVNLKKPPLT